MAQRQRLADSLATLPLVRQAAWQYRLSAEDYRAAVLTQRELTTDARAQATNWKARARKRGLLNYLLLALVGSLTYFSIRG